MKNKILLTASALTLIHFGMLAAPITPEQALSRINGNFNTRGASVRLNSPELIYTTMSEQLLPTSYLFNGEEGFLILSADDSAIPVLGYGHRKVDANNLPQNLLSWLDGYAREIEYLRERGINVESVETRAPENMAPISPLLTTYWDQDYPYNAQCPQVNGTYTFTGCVATAMAQAMNYFKYPDVGEGSLQYTSQSIGRKMSINFSRTPFDWENMLDSYKRGNFSQAQVDAVAYLMKACGYSVEMNYNVSASGTQNQLVAAAAKKYFKYDPNTFSYYRDMYSTSEWTQMIYDNLANVGPIVMGGTSPEEGGHSFVCDGYDGNGYFHFNWGWSGVSDGYYALNALSPEVLGIGGYEGGFNYNQDAVLGMQPPTGEPVKEHIFNIYQYGYTVGSLIGKTLTFDVKSTGGTKYLGWGDVQDQDITMNIGAIITPMDGGNDIAVKGKMGNSEVLSLVPASYYTNTMAKPVVDLPVLSDGVYKVTLAAKNTKVADAPWLPVFVKWSYPNYVMLTVANGNYTVENVTPDVIKLDEGYITSPLYFNRYVEVEATLTNDNDIELTRFVAPVLFSNGQKVLTGSAESVTLEAKETATKTWYTKFTSSNGYKVTQETEFTLKFYDSANDSYYDGESTVVMMPDPGNVVPSLMGFDIPGAERGPYQSGNVSYNNIYYVPSDEFTVEFKYRVAKGFYDGVISAGIYESDGNTNYLVPVLLGIYEDRPLVEGDQTVSVSVPVDFVNAQPGKLYVFSIQYSTGRSSSSLGQGRFLIGESGVASIETEDTGEATYFNLQGVKVDNPSKGQLLIERKGNESRKIIFK